MKEKFGECFSPGFITPRTLCGDFFEEQCDPFTRAVRALENIVPDPDLRLFGLIHGSGFFDRPPVAGAVDPEIIVVVSMLASLLTLTSLPLTPSREN